MTDLGSVSYYYGLCITKNLDNGTIFLTQKTYVKKILKSFRIPKAKGIDILIAKKNILIYANLSYQANLLTITWYQQSVNSLLYILTKTLFNITFVVLIFSQCTNNLYPEYVLVMKHFFLYFRKYPSLAEGLYIYKINLIYFTEILTLIRE